MRLKTFLLLLACLTNTATHCPAVELKISVAALERTLQAQLFANETGRYYIKGNPKSACFAYAQDPSIVFVNDRIVVRVQAHARLGTAFKGSCLGVAFNRPAAVSLVPAAEGETIGFKDARIEQVSDSRELNFVLRPFLSGRVPSSLQINAATILRRLLEKSRENTGYTFSLDHLQIQSMTVVGDSLIVELDGVIGVQ